MATLINSSNTFADGQNDNQFSSAATVLPPRDPASTHALLATDDAPIAAALNNISNNILNAAIASFASSNSSGSNNNNRNDSDDYDLSTNYSIDGGDGGAEPSHSLPLLIFMSIGFFIIIFASICGNILVIFAVYKNLRLRSKTNFFIVSLAAADLLVAILAMTFNASALTLTPATTWSSVGPVFCKFWLASDIFFSTASTLHLCAIAVDRYTAILHPFRYMDIMNKRHVIMILTTIWILSAALAYGPVYTDVYTRDEPIPMSGTIEECDLLSNYIFAIISSCITFWIPCITMSAIYTRVFIEASRQERAISSERKRLQSQMQQSYSFKGAHLGDSNQNLSMPPTPELTEKDRRGTAGESIRSGDGGGSRMERKLKRERKAAKTLAIIMGTFIICWLPFFMWYTLNFVFYDNKLIPPDRAWIVDLFFWIGYLNSALNPIIYAYFNRDFRHAFKKLLYCDAVAAAAARCKTKTKASSKRNENGFDTQQNPLNPLQENSSN